MFEGSGVYVISAIIIVVVLVLFLRRGRSVFAKNTAPEGDPTATGGPADAARFELTQIPADEPGTREYILRDDATGSRIQVQTVYTRSRVVQIVIPKKHLGAGVEFVLYEALSARIPDIESWIWPPMTPTGREALAGYVRSHPGTTFIDADGFPIR